MHFEPALTPCLIFSDTVIREEGTGKHSIIGSFQHFNVARFPFVAPPFVVTACFSNLRGRIDHLNLTVRVEDSTTGVVLACVSREIQLQVEATPSDCFEVPFGLPPCQFPRAGSYAVVFLINNEQLGQRPLLIREIQPKAFDPQTKPQD